MGNEHSSQRQAGGGLGSAVGCLRLPTTGLAPVEAEGRSQNPPGALVERAPFANVHPTRNANAASLRGRPRWGSSDGLIRS